MSFARHCVPPHPCRRHLRALGNLELEWPCATRPHRPPLGGVNMECTNGQPAGYRRHCEQSNPKAVSRYRSGVKNNLLHHRDFYTSSDFPANQEKKRANERNRTAYPCSLRVIGHMLQRLANPAFLEGFLCPALHRVAPYCAPGGIRVVSGGCVLRGARSSDVAGARGSAE